MPDLYCTLSIITLILALCSILGCIWAFRSGLSRTVNEVQERVINALEITLEDMRKRF
jgi:hypothetical protein